MTRLKMFLFNPKFPFDVFCAACLEYYPSISKITHYAFGAVNVNR